MKPNRFRFRAWNPIAEEMAYDVCYDHLPDGTMELGFGATVMQSTGLCDGYQREIFEGDILAIMSAELCCEDVERWVRVGWDAEEACFKASERGYEALTFELPYSFYMHEVNRSSRIVGNIYENPELLPEETT